MPTFLEMDSLLLRGVSSHTRQNAFELHLLLYWFFVMFCLFCGGWHCRVLTRFFFCSDGSDTVLCHVPSTNAWQRWQKRRRARRLVSTCCGETSVLKQRLPGIQRRGIAYLTSVACHIFADARGRTLRSVPLGWSPLSPPPSFLILSLMHKSRLRHTGKKLLCSVQSRDMVLPFWAAPSGFSHSNWLCALNRTAPCTPLAWCGLLLTRSSSQVSGAKGSNLVSSKITILESLFLQSLNLWLQL